MSSRLIKQIINKAGLKDKSIQSSIKQQITQWRNYHKFHTGLQHFIWRLETEINCPVLKYEKAKTPSFDESEYLRKYTPEEFDKLRQAKKLLEEVFDRQSYNNNTQKLIKIVKDYDRSKQNG